MMCCGGVLLVAAVLTPSSDAVSLLGWDIPALCLWRVGLGMECLGCGMIRSVVFAAHGDWSASVAMHPLGLVGWFGLVAGLLGPLAHLALGRKHAETHG
ncbi:MAG: DUF2752 domain-containing protein [Myxococcota bacterium]